MSESVDLLFGKGQLKVQLPDEAQVTLIEKPPMPICSNPDAAVRTALNAPIGCEPLHELASGAATACIAICDITRPVPNHLFLRPIIEALVNAGIALESITVVVATGLHRPNEGSELAELIGDPWVLSHVKCENHFANNDEDHVDLGVTPTRATPIRIDRRFAEADIRIVTGLVEPHFMAGYSGGRKVIAPGLAHADVIRTFHNHDFMANPDATNCNLDKNPLHEEQLEIVRALGGALAINTVIDDQRQLSMVNFGEIVASHQAAVDFVQEFCRVAVPESFSVVLTSSAGYPLDKTFYQTVKGICGGIGICSHGGDLFIASECSEGLGSEHYVAAQRALFERGPSGFLESIANKPLADIDAWQTQKQSTALAQATISLFSKLTEAAAELTGVTCCRTLRDFEIELAAAIRASSDQRVAVIPEGPYVIPFVE
ncbi:MAG TPA: nickel-dependent lactate racemase [Planctomycetaceae bacterium]|nr:nickel-dependent lactate racemase [Planctomycetaceae bacterium]